MYSAIRTKPFPGDWDLHCVGICLEKIYDKNPIEQFADVFLWLYENGPCSYCREGFVKRLWKMGRLPETILEECLNDCNSDIRKWANAPNEEGEDEEK